MLQSAAMGVLFLSLMSGQRQGCKGTSAQHLSQGRGSSPRSQPLFLPGWLPGFLRAVPELMRPLLKVAPTCAFLGHRAELGEKYHCLHFCGVKCKVRLGKGTMRWIGTARAVGSHFLRFQLCLWASGGGLLSELCA